MICSRRVSLFLLSLLVCPLALFGCQSQAVTSVNPQARLNPALSTHQKEVLASRATRSGN